MVTILGQYTYMYKVYLVMVHSYQVMHKMNSYNVYISIFIYGVETLNIYICKYRYIYIYYYTYGYTLGSQGTKSDDLVWTII